MPARVLAAMLLACVGLLPGGAAEVRIANADEFHKAIHAARPGDRIVSASGSWHFTSTFHLYEVNP